MKRILFALTVLALVLTACGGMRSSAEAPLYGVGGGGDGYYPQEYAATQSYSDNAVRSPESGGANVEAVARERMVIKNADLSVVVKDPEADMAVIAKMAEEMGGYLVSSNLYQAYAPVSGAQVPEANVVVRVPAEKLDEAMETIKSSAVEVQSENVSGTDVTSQYVDLESQLKNLRAAEAQLMEIMKGAITTEDVLNVYSQLTSIRGQIESITGQMKYYEESAALSSLTVRLVAEETIQPITIGGWHPGAWASDAIQSFVYFLQDFTEFLIRFLLNILPQLLIIGVVFGLPLRWIWRKLRGRKTAAMPKEEKK